MAAIDLWGGAWVNNAPSCVRWVVMHYAWMLVSTAVIAAAPRRRRLALALAASTAGIGLDRMLGRSAEPEARDGQ